MPQVNGWGCDLDADKRPCSRDAFAGYQSKLLAGSFRGGGGVWPRDVGDTSGGTLGEMDGTTERPKVLFKLTALTRGISISAI